jgi:imidazolonepropionase
MTVPCRYLGCFVPFSTLRLRSFHFLNLFVKNISQLVTVAAHGKRTKTGSDMRDIGVVADAGVLCRDGKIVWVGRMSDWDQALPPDFPEIDAHGKVVLPGFVDSHTHMMFAGDRSAEFALRSQGATYQQIADAGGGILETVRSVRAATKKELKRLTSRFGFEMMRSGTTSVEIKTGYGLTMDAEVKMLEAIHELEREEMISVTSTFLGAHAIPPEFRADHAAYTTLVIEQMIPYAGKKHLATFCDVFCEKGYFSVEESTRILDEGKRWGLLPKVHADELTDGGGAELAARVGAISADHLEHVSKRGIEALKETGVIATLLPGVSLFLNHGYAPARDLIDAGVAVAIASDFNPGSCMSFSMPLMMTIACTQMRMSPEEAITAATLNGAAALTKSDSTGSIEIGKEADILIVDIPDYRHLVYHFGVNHVRTVIKAGTVLEF